MACVCGAQDGAFGATALLFVLYGPASAGFSYFTSFLFKEHSSGQSFILMSNVFSIILVLTSFVLGFIDSYVTRCAGVPQPQPNTNTNTTASRALLPRLVCGGLRFVCAARKTWTTVCVGSTGSYLDTAWARGWWCLRCAPC